jgi:hypothetical protein
MSFHYTAERGLGASSSQVVSAATGATTALAPTIASTIGLTASLGATAAIPIVGAAIAGIGFAIEAILNSGCGQSCVITSNWANQAEAQLQQNISAYFAVPAPRPASVQTAALGNFDAVWNYLEQQCNQVPGAPGQDCISDRQAGACKWKQTTTPPWGSPVQGACWNWFNGYRDPIANDPNVVQDSEVPTTITNAVSSVDGGVSGIPSIVWIAAAALAVGWLVTK